MTSRVFALVSTFSLLAAVLISGCSQRQEIIEQTVAVKGQDAATEALNMYVDEALVTWTSEQEVDPGFEKATAVAFDGADALYVAGDEAVRKMTGDGQVEWEMPVSGEPLCLTIGPDGSIVVGLRDRVEVYDQGGQLTDAADIGEHRTWLTSVAVGAGGIYIADAGNRRILRYGNDGQLSVFISKDDGRDSPPLSVPSPHLDVKTIVPENSSAGLASELVVVNPGRHSLQYHSLPGGDMQRSWDSSGNSVEGFGGCCNPTDIAILPGGRVATSEKGVPRVKVYSADGEFLSVVAPPDDFRPGSSGIDIAADSQGRIAVLDPKRSVVRLYVEKNSDQETVSE